MILSNTFECYYHVLILRLNSIPEIPDKECETRRIIELNWKMKGTLTVVANVILDFIELSEPLLDCWPLSRTPLF